MISEKQRKELIEYYSRFDLEDPPTEVWEDGTKVWRNSDGYRHRENDRPAYITFDGYMSWNDNHNWHGETGPAIIWNDGNCKYYINAEEISHSDWFKRIMELN